MKQTFKIIPVLISALITISSFAQDITGQWNGILEIQGTQLRIVFHISKDGDDYSATMDSPDQGAKGIPVKEVSFKDSILSLKIPNINFEFSGKVNEDYSIIEGNFTQFGSSYPLNLEREKVEKQVIKRPQEPALPFPYYSEDVKFENKKDSLILAGTLTLPGKDGKYPAFILISGSGAQDRNEEIFNHKPFLVLADHLTKNGIAVLRFDDRGTGESTGDFKKATSEDFATDILAGIDFLKSRKEIQLNQIGLIGHSEGGIIAPMIASENSDVAFIVLLAGPGTTGEEILISQLRLIGKAEGEENIDEKTKVQKEIIDIIKSENDRQIAEQKLKALFEREIDNLSEEEKKQIENADVYIQSQIDAINNDWFRFFITYDPKPVLTKVKCPVLALIGEKDLQVPSQENLEAIGEALKAGGNKDYTIKILPGLNHLFQTAETGSVSEYAEIEETFSPLALNEISNWILKHVKK